MLNAADRNMEWIFRPYFFIAAQIAQAALPIQVALAGQLGQQ